MSKRCRRKLINNIIDDEEELGGKSNSKLPIFEKQSPPNSNTKPTWASKPSIEDSSDEEIFPIKRLKNSDSLQIEENKTSYHPKESGSPQKVNIFEEIKQTDIRKQKPITNKHANFFIITSTGKLYNKAKIGVEYAKNNDERNPVETNELEETIYLSPSTGKSCQVLQNVTIPCSSVPTTPRQQIRKNKNLSSFCSLSMDFPHLNSESRTSSLSEISCSNLLDCDLSLNEENIKKLLHEQTPEQKRSCQNFRSECAVSNDSNLSNCKEKKAIEVTVIVEDVSKDIDRKKQNRVNKLSTVLKLPDSIDYDRIEHLNSDNETIIENRTRDNLPDILKSPDANNCNNDSSESEESDIISLEGCIGTEQELSSDESENTENDTLDEEEALPSRQINKNDDDEWIDISESPVNFDEFVGENTYNIPSFVKSSEDVYKLFVTEEMINKMVSETNNYARNYLRTNQLNMKRKSRMKHWTDTNLQEMKTFLAVVMAMGLCKVPLINLYWSKNNLYRNEFISSAMTRDRFLLLLKCWHVSDVSNDDKTDKLYKIRDMLSMITDNFQNILNPGKYVVIDETMIPWRGRLGFRQYIKNKSHRYGVKLYKLCTPEGYTYQIEIYTGKTDQKKEVDHSQKVVLRLMNNLIEQGRIVIVDNFYTSVTLAEKLLSQKTFVCGTLNVRRKYLPKKVVNANIKKGQIIGKMNKKGVKVLKWVDKRNVLMLTTCKDHDDKLIDTGKKKRGTNECIKKPGCVIMYNETKKGIDYSDQMSSYYTTLKKGIKWWRKVIMELIFGTALINAWIVYNSINDDANKLPKRQFVEQLIEAFTKNDLDVDTEPTPNNPHHLEKRSKKRRCVGCYEKLRTFLSSREADKKAKKILTECIGCKKYYCLTCFNKNHP
ncbi:unnamed protein product [Arctia plantaginis]|uniref:PiggyBac transposable element-derived protein domain-containing protein n=1 Tax=Arctia plantaginis TaxID=874455 RepID=A0A8S1ALV9_ARCPL|nr:unnamed protein product [Arctia plantaginis]